MSDPQPWPDDATVCKALDAFAWAGRVEHHPNTQPMIHAMRAALLAVLPLKGDE